MKSFNFGEFISNLDFSKTDKNLSENEIMQKFYEVFKEKWFVSYDYVKTAPIHFKSKDIDIKLNHNFTEALHYCNSTSYKICNYDFEVMHKVLRKEVEHYEMIGGSCIYNAVLLYNLLIHNKVCDPEDLNLVQGYYKHKVREDYPLASIFGKTHRGLHTWLSYKGAVIDCMIASQEGKFFDFGDIPIILGIMPEGFELIGYEEPYETVKKYTKQIIKNSRIGYKSWIEIHNTMSKLEFLEELKNYLSEKEL